jgi:LacI family transcriptional regulator
MGYKNIGLIAYKSEMFHMRERIRGYSDAMKAHKITLKKKWLQEVKFNNAKTEVEEAIDNMLAAGTPVEAIIFSTYSLAVNGLKYINRLGIKVPNDLAIVSFGQAEVFDLYSCPITYVMQDMDNLGKAAVDILVKKMENPKEKTQEVLMEAKLITRESSRPKGE